MDERQLSYFVSVAEHLSFTKAARQHFIAQTSISQQILALENKLRVKLFERNNRSVQLTTAGRVLYIEAKQLLAKSDAIIEKVRRAADGLEGSLTVGFQGSHLRKVLPSLLKHFRFLYPGIDLKIAQPSPEFLIEGLKNGRIDVLFHSYYRGKTPGDLHHQTLYLAPLCAVVSNQHPFANQRSLKLEDLASEPIIHNYPGESGYYDHFVSACARSGFTPNIVAQAYHYDAQLIMVEAEFGITVLPRYYRDQGNENLKFIPLEGEDLLLEVGLSWAKNNSNPAIHMLAKLVEENTGGLIDPSPE